LSVVLSNDGSKLATRGKDGITRVWDSSGQQLAELKGPRWSVESVVFSPDGSKLATRDEDGTIQIWDLSGRQIAKYDGRGLISPNWQSIAIITTLLGSNDQVVQLRPLDNLDGLLARACTQLQFYLKQNPDLSDSDRHLCDDIPTQTSRK
jgi:WD40 repeat protein